MKDAILAVSLTDLNDEDSRVANIDTYVQPVFFTASRDNEGNWSNKVFYEAIPCEEVFGEKVDQTASLAAALESNGPWYCPKDMESYQVLN